MPIYNIYRLSSSWHKIPQHAPNKAFKLVEQAKAENVEELRTKLLPMYQKEPGVYRCEIVREGRKGGI